MVRGHARTKLLARGVPPGGTSRFREWQEKCRRLPPPAIDICLAALKNRSERFHQAALVILRLNGFEAWARGYGKNRIFEIRRPGAATTEQIIPRWPPLKASAA